MPRRILALDIGEHELNAAVLETSFRDYHLANVAYAPLELGTGSVPEQIRRFVEQNAAGADTVLSALPGDRVVWRTLRLPFRDRKRLGKTVPFEIESLVPFDLEDVVVDYHVLHRDREGTTVLAALTRREDLEKHLELLHGAGLDPKIVDLRPLATLNSLRLVPDLASDFAFVDLCGRAVTVALYRQKELVGLRVLTPEGGAGAAEEDGSGGGGAEAAVIRELRWTLLAMNDGPTESGLPCYLAGKRENLDRLAGTLATTLSLDVRRLDSIDVRLPNGSGDADVAGFTSTVGLALREVIPAATAGVNFRRGEYTYQRSQQELHRGLWGVAVLAAVVVALTVADLYVGYRQQTAHVRDLQQQIVAVARATLPEGVGGRDPVATLQDEIDGRQHDLDILNEIVPVSGSTSLDVFRAVSAAIPNRIRIDAADYMMDADAIRMRGNTDSFESVDAIKQEVLTTGFFSDVQVRDARAARNGSGINFRLIMKLSKDVRRAGETP